MSRNGLDRFFEQMLAETDSVEDPAIPTARRALGAALPYMSDEIYESEAAQCFLDRVAAGTAAPPPELVAAVTAEFPHPMRKSAVIRPRKRVVPLWGWAAGAVAASVLAILAGTRLSQNYAAPQVRVAGTPPVSVLQAPVKSAIDNPLSPPPPAPARPKGAPEPVYTAPNPPVALTSHAVTAADYPVDSVRLLEQGTVRLQYTIETDGTVSNCIVTMTSGFARLDEAACIVVQKWTFKPATVIGGAPVALIVPAQIVFALAPAPALSGPPPALVQSGKSGVLLDGEAFNAIGVPVLPRPTPPVAITSHAVTVDDYPPESVSLGEQGKVQIKYTIGTDGIVSECVVTMSSGIPRLDDGACTMVKTKWKFKPATQDGRPVAVSIPAEIIFALK